MAKKKGLTATQKEYNKQLARVKRALREQAKKGFLVEEFKIPKTLKAIKKVTPKVIREKSKYVSRETGEILKGKTAQQTFKQERKEELRKRREEKQEDNYPRYNIFDHIEDMIEAIVPVIHIYSASARKYIEYRWQSEFPLMKIFIDKMIEYENDLMTLARLYEEEEEELAFYLTRYTDASELEQLRMHFSRTATLLNVGTLNAEQSRSVGQMSDELGE